MGVYKGKLEKPYVYESILLYCRGALWDTTAEWRASAPPLAPAKAFSRSGCGRIFPLYSGVTREGLSTALAAKRGRKSSLTAVTLWTS